MQSLLAIRYISAALMWGIWTRGPGVGNLTTTKMKSSNAQEGRGGDVRVSNWSVYYRPKHSATLPPSPSPLPPYKAPFADIRLPPDDPCTTHCANQREPIHCMFMVSWDCSTHPKRPFCAMPFYFCSLCNTGNYKQLKRTHCSKKRLPGFIRSLQGSARSASQSSQKWATSHCKV